jgi:hypothetical protein
MEGGSGIGRKGGRGEVTERERERETVKQERDADPDFASRSEGLASPWIESVLYQS